MSGYNFTDRVRKALQLARDEATRLRQAHVDSEHVLLGLLREGGGVAVPVLVKLHVDLDDLRRRTELLAGRERGAGPAGGDLPYTSQAKRAIEFAMKEAAALHHRFVGTEHLLLGLLRDERGGAAKVLLAVGVTLERARAEVLRLLGRGARDVDPGTAAVTMFHVRIDDASQYSIYEQIVAQVREATATGELGPGDRLPAVREMADELDIAPGTVARAYGELERLGVVVTDGARGTRVAARVQKSGRAGERENLPGLLRPVAVAAYHLGATAEDLRRALEEAMRGIFGAADGGAAAT